ncbi:23S rRNA (pseudouridine(1915)-N(3))-methyltransferase RlmH [Marinicella litoralis]|uniref:Ribosomal RNA large subunit methyltransferase H n=1 Tax=Marinicella litoralis TaxID=644220 RepID=A0A4R6XSL5_9GAMM|nr:23S rRNA (pseudouridine(1915)-N(3))-methyltransferase RlmH [Marinicella litoralis]TDR19328.1 23S rRNA (pseudouridine1915-N3)-methyltransferase [Marinicella litoralis]
MKISLLSLGHKMPDWVNAAYQTYNDRLPAHLKINLVELNPVSRQKGLSIAQIKSHEAQIISKQLKPGALNIALDEKGRSISTTFLSQQLANWQMQGQDINLIIGGADGLDESILKLAKQTWSLSKLIFPHQLVRVIMAEQIYRAYSMLNNHPYHRE